MGISSVIKKIEKFQNKTKSNQNEIFFRGQKSSDKLVPKLLRSNPDGGEENEYKENLIYCDSWIIGNNEFINCRNSWEILAKMQHYEIATRLLDWTSSLLSGIYFAISECIDCKTQCKEDKDKKPGCRGNPCLWVLNSRFMHNEFYPHNLDKIAFTIGIDKLIDYVDAFVKQEEKIEWEYNKGPIFLEMPWSNSRITSQKGYFTFHSDDIKNPIPLEDRLSKSLKSKSWLLKIEIDTELKDELVKEFKIMGISEFDIYPGLSSIGRHTIRNLKG